MLNNEKQRAQKKAVTTSLFIERDPFTDWCQEKSITVHSTGGFYCRKTFMNSSKVNGYWIGKAIVSHHF